VIADKGAVVHKLPRLYSFRPRATQPLTASVLFVDYENVGRVKAAPTDRLAEALQWLKGTQKNRRPRRRKGLAAHLFHHFGRKIPEEKIPAFIDQLIADTRLSKTNDAITYHF
jgi:hypothetical protein